MRHRSGRASLIELSFAAEPEVQPVCPLVSQWNPQSDALYLARQTVTDPPSTAEVARTRSARAD